MGGLKMATDKRLIDPSELKRAIVDFKLNLHPKDQEYGTDYFSAVSVVEGMLAYAKTVDAVEVVRCKDCKYSRLDDVIYRKTIYGETNDTTLYCCFYHWNRNEWNKGEHFCSYGERKGND
jgi:hypothetical protein